jgi:peptidoglycan/LPS O-acetylase OafA/YrhL
MTPGRSKLGYVPELDGLRGIAILAVMGFHSRVSFFAGGHIGVDIFFVLSGFLITTLLIQEFDESGSISLSNFYIRRVLRLGPALIAFLIVFCLASFAFQAKKQLIVTMSMPFFLLPISRILHYHIRYENIILLYTHGKSQLNSSFTWFVR